MLLNTARSNDDIGAAEMFTQKDINTQYKNEQKLDNILASTPLSLDHEIGDCT